MADKAITSAVKSAPVEPGILERVKAGVRYIIKGAPPETWFGPMQPLAPVSQESAGRLFDYPIAYNIQMQPRAYEAVSYQDMRALADNYDLLRLVIETRKDQIEKFQWRIKLKLNGEKPDKLAREKAKGRIDQVSEFLQYPDKEHTWSTWVRMLMEEMLVIDATTVYPRQTIGGGLYSLDLMAGDTIVRKLSKDGRTPIPPDVAYQQYIKGVPMADYTRDEIVFYPRNARANRAYGYSPVEQIIMTVNIALRRQVFQLNYYTEGNVPEALIPVPESWTSDQISQFQTWWDNLMEGDLAQRRHAKFVPSGLDKIHETKAAALKDEYDEWLARIICYAFSVPPTPFVKQMNRSTSETVQAAALQEGLIPLQTWIKNLLDLIIWKYLGQKDLEFAWEEEEELGPQEQASMVDLKVRNGTMTIDEARDLDGKDPYPGGIGGKPLVYTMSGPVLLESALEPPEPVDKPPKENPPVPKEKEVAEKLAKTGKKKMKKLSPIDRDRHKVKKARKDIKGLLMPLFNKALKAAKALPIDTAQKADDDLVQKIIDKLDLDGWAILTDDIEEILAAVTEDGTYEALLQIGMSEEDLTTTMAERAVTWAESRAAELITKISDSTRDMIRADVAQAIEEGQSVKQFADALEENYGFSEARAEMIARTETAFADVQGNMIAYKESGVVSGKEWIVGSGHDNDDECDENQDAGVVDLDADFPSGDDAPPAHPN